MPGCTQVPRVIVSRLARPTLSHNERRHSRGWAKDGGWKRLHGRHHSAGREEEGASCSGKIKYLAHFFVGESTDNNITRPATHPEIGACTKTASGDRVVEWSVVRLVSVVERNDCDDDLLGCWCSAEKLFFVVRPKRGGPQKRSNLSFLRRGE